jgi:hypothetical protein
MKTVRCIKTACLFLALAAFVVGCKSEKSETDKSSGASKDKTSEATPAAPGKAGASAVSPQDKTDASAAAARVHAQLKSGDYATIYKESADSFKKLGTEAQFVSMMQQAQQKTGAFKDAKETSVEAATGPDAAGKYLVNSKVEYDKNPAKEHLLFARSKSGKMELCEMSAQ